MAARYAGSEGLTVTTLGETATSVTGAKSLIGSCRGERDQGCSIKRWFTCTNCLRPTEGLTWDDVCELWDDGVYTAEEIENIASLYFEGAELSAVLEVVEKVEAKSALNKTFTGYKVVTSRWMKKPRFTSRNGDHPTTTQENCFCGTYFTFAYAPRTTGMKILFLDIDGVLNSRTTKPGDDGDPFGIHPGLRDRLLRVIEATGAKIVISSSWRSTDRGLGLIRAAGIEYIGTTPHCCTGIRGAEIYDWMSKNIPWEERKNGTFRYAILDDDSNILLRQKDHFFQTSIENGGLTDEIAARVIAHLNT
jgi:hypothetical protein